MIILSIVVLFALIGYNMLDLSGSNVKIIEETKYSTFGSAVRNTFLMTTLSNYPNVAVPYLE